jgi:hypothetical protein
MTRVLTEAPRRGVRVVVLLPGAIDNNIVRHASRSQFGALSFAKTSSAQQVVDSGALIRPQSRLVSTLLLHLLRLRPFLVGGHRQIALENLALRQQLVVYKRAVTRPSSARRIVSSGSGWPDSG